MTAEGAYFQWVDDECAGITCGCGAEMMISTSCPRRCPQCKRIYQLWQESRIDERSPDDVTYCRFCGGVAYDDGSYCPECQLNSEGRRA